MRLAFGPTDRLLLARYIRFGRFTLVGSSNAVVSYAMFLGLFAVLPASTWRTEVSQAVAYLAGMTWSFFWNRQWVFGSAGHAAADAARFIVSQLLLLGFSVALVSICVDHLELGPAAGWILAMGVVTILNYWVLSRVVFESSR